MRKRVNRLLQDVLRSSLRKLNRPRTSSPPDQNRRAYRKGGPPGGHGSFQAMQKTSIGELSSVLPKRIPKKHRNANRQSHHHGTRRLQDGRWFGYELYGGWKVARHRENRERKRDNGPFARND